MRRRKTLYGPVGGRLIALAILALLAATLFSYQRFSSTRVVEAQASRPPRKTRGKLETQTRAPIFVKSFKHLSHRAPKTKLDCSDCHTIPTQATPDVITAATKTSIKGYPYHDSCTDCHRRTPPQFFRGATPSICTVCHTRSSPRLTARDMSPFPKHNEREMELEFPGYFPHGIEQHQDKSVKCIDCHMKNERADAAIARGGSEKPSKPEGTFKTSPSDHATCFRQCHWQKDKPGVSFFSEGVPGVRVDGGCAGCHLTPPEIAKEPRNQLSENAQEWFKNWPHEWPKRLSLKFNHESKEHLEQKCTLCHTNLKQMNTLDMLKADVGIASCKECHILRQHIQVGKDGVKVSISDEMCMADPKCEQNPSPGNRNTCVACHTSDIGREPPPCTHYAVIGEPCPKAGQ